ncbi:hypothetical protein OAO87_04755, partial [bacterium]|nr:hypothetical protein [bacterium]
RSAQPEVRGLMGRACMSCLLRAAWPLPRGASGGEHGEVVWVGGCARCDARPAMVRGPASPGAPCARAGGLCGTRAGVS